MFSDQWWWADLIRLIIGITGLWLGVLVIRLASATDNPAKPNWATYASYALALLLMGLLRIGHIGDEPTWDLWVAAAIVGLGLYGVLRRTRFNMRPPHRR